jgi:hypothetical protein
MENPRTDRPSRKNFGPDAKPARVRAQKFKPDSGKKSFKERLTGQIFGAEDEDDLSSEPDIDNFATGLDEDEQ